MQSFDWLGESSKFKVNLYRKHFFIFYTQIKVSAEGLLHIHVCKRAIISAPDSSLSRVVCVNKRAGVGVSTQGTGINT